MMELERRNRGQSGNMCEGEGTDEGSEGSSDEEA